MEYSNKGAAKGVKEITLRQIAWNTANDDMLLVRFWETMKESSLAMSKKDRFTLLLGLMGLKEENKIVSK